MQNPQLWELIRETAADLVGRYEPEIDRACSAIGIDPRMWGLLLAVLTFEPEDTTPAHLLVRGPYTSAEAYLERLNQATKLDLLEEREPGGYCLTAKGRQATLEIVERVRKLMAKLDPLSAEDSERVACLGDRLVQSCLDNPTPPHPWSIRMSYKLMPAMRPPLPYIEQLFSCLAAYRDDAHLSAWQDSGLSAMALECLSLLWRGEASSLDDLCHKLANRGHPCQVYVGVLDELRQLGFIQGPDHAPALTGAGRVFRNQVEAKTDNLFFAPWDCLTDVEKAELGGLLKRLKSGLRPSD